MVNDFGTVVRQMYEKNLKEVRQDFEDLSDDGVKQLACEFTEDDVALKARELIEIWRDVS